MLRAKADLDGTSGARQAAYLEAARLDPTHREALAGVDDELTFPLRLGFWLMWLLVLPQAVLLALGIDGGPVLGLLALLVVLPLAWVGFLVVRREAAPDPARRGFDGLLLGFGVCLFLSVPLLPAVDPRHAAVGRAGRLRPGAGRRRRALPHPPPSAAASSRRVTSVAERPTRPARPSTFSARVP